MAAKVVGDSAQLKILCVARYPFAALWMGTDAKNKLTTPHTRQDLHQP